ncbi:MAG: tRNA pseudouridine(13) synthase TruD [Pseudohongiella sp.]|nr:tRNA pseudouridine(13) synthase TruD [Pseudohongiella sp.]MDO9519828.1 tRNA pseudouridine(13) synthase TruD [Pseudohongiella sp.]MDP2126206.1 tRNA pseudouridine(13) synthase TruD [Pseudohongiella sp.]
MNLHRTSEPLLRAVFKQQSADFCVDEELGFECTGEGEHIWVLIRKTGINTQEAAQRLARAAGIPIKNVYWSGLKDKHGVCRQWLSLHMPGREIPPALISAESEALVIEAVKRNVRKLSRGSHRANHFSIRLRNLQLASASCTMAEAITALENNLQRVQQQGVPNYFGEQRFGFDNIAKAQAWFAREYRPRNTTERGLLLSAARSAIFNSVLTERVRTDSWNRYLDGDVMNLNGSASVFVPGQCDEVLLQRISEGDIHATGPMWGRGDMRTSALCRELEERVAGHLNELATGLIAHNVDASRRSLRLPVQALHYRFLMNMVPPQDMNNSADGPDLELSFALPSGAYATAVLHDLIEYTSP